MFIYYLVFGGYKYMQHAGPEYRNNYSLFFHVFFVPNDMQLPDIPTLKLSAVYLLEMSS